MTTKDWIAGTCKECFCPLTNEDIEEEYPDIFHCPMCGYPNTRGDMHYVSEEQYEESLKAFRQEHTKNG